MTGSESELGHEELARRVKQLEEENARPRDLLGLEHRRSGGHATAWAPTLLTVPCEQVPIDATATDGKKLILLWSRFGARSDVFATRLENASTGKAGWSPATPGGWSRQRFAISAAFGSTGRRRKSR